MGSNPGMSPDLKADERAVEQTAEEAVRAEQATELLAVRRGPIDDYAECVDHRNAAFRQLVQ